MCSRGEIAFGVEYNFVPETDLTVPNKQEEIGTVDKSYSGLLFGLVVGDESTYRHPNNTRTA